MDTALAPVNSRQILTEVVCEVFDSMLSMKAEPAPPPEVQAPVEWITGCVGFGGDSVTGAVHLRLSADFGRQAAAATLGLTVAEVEGDDVINDVVGELTNILSGRLRSVLSDAGFACGVSTPTIIRGTFYEIEATGNVQRERLWFVCQQERLLIELHIQFT
jgi:flagellar motor switch protein FliN